MDRRKPLPPARPLVSIGRANVYGQSEAKLNWSPTPDVLGYNLYRSVDTAIYSRDLDQRRLQIGYYTDIHAFADDGYNDTTNGDVHEFIRAVQHKKATDFAPNFEVVFEKALLQLSIADLFWNQRWKKPEELTATETHPTLHPKWQALNPIWQYWADRFYPSRSDLDLQGIAERKGNETAFTLVNEQPIRSTDYTDTVSGVVSNRYYYRLRTVAHNASLGSTWGLVSAGARVDVPALRPRTPVWTKVGAGDREVTLQWALNREPNFREYRLYRADDPARLEDLRWAEVEPQEGLDISTIPDPRILTQAGNQLNIPDDTGLPLGATILGVFRADEFKSTAADPMAQPQAMNYYKNGGLTDANALRSIAANSEMVLVYRNTNGYIQVLMAWPGYPYMDKGLVGLKDYWYRVEAVNEMGVKSGESEVRRVKALEMEPPPAPEVLEKVRIAGAEVDIIRLTIGMEPNLELMIQGRSERAHTWSVLQEWSIVTEPTVIWESEIEMAADYEVRIWSRTSNKLNCIEPQFHYFNQ